MRKRSALRGVPAGLLLTLSVLAAELGAEIPDPLNVAFVPNLYPVSFLNDQGEPDGAFPRVVREVAREAGFSIRWSEGSWGANLERVRRGELDLMIGLVYTPERDEFLDYGRQSVLSTWSQVFAAREGVAENFFDVEGKRVGMMVGDQNAAAFIDLAEGFGIRYQSVYFETMEEIYTAMTFGDVDLGVFYNLFNLSHVDLVPTNMVFQPNNSYFAVPEGADPAVLNLIDDRLAQWKNDDDSFYYREVMSLLEPATVDILPRWLVFLIAGLAGLAVAGGLWTWLLRRQVRQRTSALVDAQAAYRSTFFDADVGIIHADPDGRILRVNPWFCSYIGYKEKELLQMSGPELTHPDDRDRESKLFGELRDGTKEAIRFDKRYLGQDGRIRWGHLNASSLRDENGELRYFIILVEDLTAQKRVESRLGDLEKVYHGVFNNSYQMTAVFDDSGRLIDANDSMKRSSDIEGDPDRGLGATAAEMEWIGPVASLRLHEMVDECLSTGRTIKHMLGFDQTSRDIAVDLTVKPIADEDSTIRYCVAEAHDITEIVRLTNHLEKEVDERTREIRDAQSQLIESEKMASLGRLVSGIAHEINTPVGVAKTGVSYLLEQVAETRKRFDDEVLSRQDFEKALESFADTCRILDQNLDRAVKLIQDFKMTSADQSNRETRVVSVHEYLEAVMHSISPRLKEAGITWNVDAPREEMLLHVGVMNQILINLSINALHHGFDDQGPGHLDIVFRTTPRGRSIIFQDNGVGIPEEDRDRIFEPFFTTRRGRGFSGLGLNIVYNLVKEVLRGSILCESRPGSGTTFRIDYPEPSGD